MMQAILKLIQAFLWAWQYAKENPRKSIAAGVGVGATSAAMLMSGVTYPPPLITAANTTNAPGANGQVLESNGDNTYTFGDPAGGPGGGATELAELDDVADTLAGAQGDFLGWDGADWDDIEVTLNTPTDVTITTPATKQTIRYDGAGWVNSQLASTDLSDFAATISGDTNDVLGWNGSAWDDVTISLGTLTDITNEASATDGLVLTANGDGTHTFEAPAVGGLLTPDGGTAITESSEWSIVPQGGSLSDLDHFITTDTEEFAGTFNATTNRFTVDSGTPTLDTGDGVRFTNSGGALPTEISAITMGVVWVNEISNGVYTMHTTREAAVAGSGAIDLSGAGTGTHTMLCHTVVTTRNAAGSTLAHNYVDGNYCVVIGGGNACAVSAPSITVSGGTASSITLGGAAYTFTIEDATDVIIASAELPAATGDRVRLTNSGGALPTGTAVDTNYFLRRLTTTRYTLHASAADATNNASKIAISGGTGTHSVVGWTEINGAARNGDGLGGVSAASTTVQAFGWNHSPRMTNWFIERFHTPIGTRSQAIYTGTTSPTHLKTIAEGRPMDSGDSEQGVMGFTGISNSGGNAQLTGISTVYVSTGDIIEIKTTSSGDSVYNVQGEVTGTTSTTITTDIAYDGTATTATGKCQAAYVEVGDYGTTVDLHAYKGMPTVRNQDMRWRAGVRCAMGQLVLSTDGTKLFRVYERTGDYFSGSSEPTWPTEAGETVEDGQLLLKKVAPVFPLNVTDGARNQFHWTRIKDAPTTTTLVLEAPVLADITTNTLALLHDDGPAIRKTRDAIAASGLGGTILVPGGRSQVVLGDIRLGTDYWGNTNNAAQPRYVWCLLGHDARYDRSINLKLDPTAGIQFIHTFASSRIDEYSTTQTSASTYSMWGIGSLRNEISGGMHAWNRFGCGLSETDGSHGVHLTWMSASMRDDAAYNAISPQWTSIKDMQVYFPVIDNANSVSLTEDYGGSRKLYATNFQWYYGGSSVDQVMLVHGDIAFTNGLICNDTMWGSHGLYINTGNKNLVLRDMEFQGISDGRTLSFRGSDGGTNRIDCLIDGLYAPHCGEVGIGDPTTSNRQGTTIVNNLRGCNLTLDESRKIIVTNYEGPSLALGEDVHNVQIAHAMIDGDLDMSGTIGMLRNCQVDDVQCNLARFGNLNGCTVRGVKYINPYSSKVSLRNYAYKYTSRGANDEYYLTTYDGRDPGIASPSYYSIRGTLRSSLGTIGSLVDYQAGYGDPDGVEVQTVTVSGSPASGSFLLEWNGYTCTINRGDDAATAQTAIRTMTGLGSVTVSTGATSSPNFTYTVTFTGVSGEVPIMTSVESLSGAGAVAHATTSGDIGFSTLVVKIGDSSYPDPDDNRMDCIFTCDRSSATVGTLLSGTIMDSTIEDVLFLNTDGTQSSGLVGNAEMYRSTLRNFKHVTMGAVLSASNTPFDFQSTNRHWRGVTLEDFSVNAAYTLGSTQVRGVNLNLTPESDAVIRRWYQPYWMGTHSSGTFNVDGGQVTLEDVQLQRNKEYMDISVSGNTLAFSPAYSGTCAAGAASTFTLDGSGPTWNDALNGKEFYVVHQNGRAEYGIIQDYVGSTKVATINGTFEGTPSSTSTYFIMGSQDVVAADGTAVILVTTSGGVPAATVGYVRDGSTSGVWDTKANAVSGGGTGRLTFTGSDSTVQVIFPELASESVLSTAEPFGATTNAGNIVRAKGVTVRGSGSWEYAQLTGNLADAHLFPIADDVHVFTSNSDTNIITGFANGWPGRTITVVCSKNSTNDINIDHQDSTGTSELKNEVTIVGGADLNLNPGEAARFTYVNEAYGWQHVGK